MNFVNDKLSQAQALDVSINLISVNWIITLTHTQSLMCDQKLTRSRLIYP